MRVLDGVNKSGERRAGWRHRCTKPRLPGSRIIRQSRQA
jgi:hypothetical protein